jgi:hypothetical protein
VRGPGGHWSFVFWLLSPPPANIWCLDCFLTFGALMAFSLHPSRARFWATPQHLLGYLLAVL